MPIRRQSLVTAVKARFTTILVAGGYLTNVGAKQHEWLSRELSKSDELPAHNVRDGEATAVLESGSKDATRHKWLLEFTVDLIFSEDDATVEDARKGIADIYRAIGVDETWKVDGEELAARTVPVADRVITDKEGNWLGGAQVVFQVEYYTDRWSAD